MKTENFEEYFRDINNVPDEASAHAKRVDNLKKLTQKLRHCQPVVVKRKHQLESDSYDGLPPLLEENGTEKRTGKKRNSLPAIEGVRSVNQNVSEMGKTTKDFGPEVGKTTKDIMGAGICDSCSKVGMFTRSEALKRSIPCDIQQRGLEDSNNGDVNGKERCIICLKFTDKLNSVLPDKPVMPYTHDFYDKFSRDSNSKIAKWDHEIPKRVNVESPVFKKTPVQEDVPPEQDEEKLPDEPTGESEIVTKKKKKVGFDGKLIDSIESEQFLNGEVELNFEDDFNVPSRASSRPQNLAPYVNGQFVMPSFDNMEKFTDIRMSTMVLQESPRKKDNSLQVANNLIEKDNTEDEKLESVHRVPELSQSALKRLPDVQPRQRIRFDLSKSPGPTDSREIERLKMKQKLHRSKAMVHINSESDKPRKVLTPMNSYKFSPPVVPEISETSRGMRPLKKASPPRIELSTRLEMKNRYVWDYPNNESKPLVPPSSSNMLSPLMVPDMFEYDDDFHRHRGLKGSIVKRELNPIHAKRQEMIKPKTKFTVGTLGLVYDIPNFTRKHNDRCGTSETEPIPHHHSPMSLLPPVKHKRRPFSYV